MSRGHKERPSKADHTLHKKNATSLNQFIIPRNKTPSEVPLTNDGSSQGHESPDMIDQPTGILPYGDANPPNIHDVYRKHDAAMEPILKHILDPDKRQQLVMLVEEYCDQNIATMTPRDLIVPYALLCMERAISRLQLSLDLEHMVELGTIILTETVEPVTIDVTTAPQSFMSIFAGNAIRLEYLGIIFAIACWASLTEIGHGKKQQEFISHLLRCSSACLQITRRLALMNDMYMWLNHHHYILIATEQGHSCEETWSCLGDVLADITKFGMYKDSYTTLNTPFFLAQWRRRFFYDVYSKDKFVATLSERPPRLLKKYSSVHLPLDLPDNVMLSSTEASALSMSFCVVLSSKFMLQ